MQINADKCRLMHRLMQINADIYKLMHMNADKCRLMQINAQINLIMNMDVRGVGALWSSTNQNLSDERVLGE
jgi:hypothetical protein